MAKSTPFGALFTLALAWAMPSEGQAIQADEAIPSTPRPAEILLRAAERYRDCRSYQDEGLVLTRFERTDHPQETRKAFQTAFARSGRFRFEFSEAGLMGTESRYIVWMHGQEVKSWWTLGKGPESEPDLARAIAGATGVSSGSAYTIPSVLMKEAAWKGGTWTDSSGVYRISDGTLGPDVCFRIQRLTSTPPGTTGELPTPATKGKRTYWIRQADHLLLRIDGETDFGSFFTRETTTYSPILDRPVPEPALSFGH